MTKLISWSWIIMKLIKKKLQNISHQKVYTFWHCIVNDEVPSTSSQMVEQIEVIQGVVLPGISKMNDAGPDKKPKEQIQFSQKKTLIKGEWFRYCLLYLLLHQLMDCVNRFINSARLFHLS